MKKKSSYQKEIRIRTAIAALADSMRDQRIDSKACYEVIGQLTVIAKQLRDKRKK